MLWAEIGKDGGTGMDGGRIRRGPNERMLLRFGVGGRTPMFGIENRG